MATDVLLLDVGEDTGALVIYAHPELDGRELEILPVHVSGHDHPVHNVVRRRRVSTGIVHAAVFPDLPAGQYVPYNNNNVADRLGVIEVVGGTITEIDWR